MTRVHPPVRALLPTCLALSLSALVAPARADADNSPGPVVPYRPSASTAAELPAPGYLELETGGLRETAATGGARRYSVPTTLKLAFNHDWGVFITGDVWARQTDGMGGRVSGGGDTTLVLKRRFGIDDKSAAGLELQTTRPTADAGLGQGAASWGVNSIYSADFGDAWHTDLNFSVTHQQAGGGQSASWQPAFAAALARNLPGGWGVVGELSGSHQSGAKAPFVALGAVSYNVSDSLVLDAGLAHGLNDAAPKLSLFGGLTVRLGRVF